MRHLAASLALAALVALPLTAADRTPAERIAELERQLADLEAENRLLLTQLQRLETTLAATGHLGDVEATADRLRGTVTAVRSDDPGEQSPVMIDLGSEDGLAAGDRVVLHRGATCLGVAEVVQVFEQASSCRLIPESLNPRQLAIETGDAALGPSRPLTPEEAAALRPRGRVSAVHDDRATEVVIEMPEAMARNVEGGHRFHLRRDGIYLVTVEALTVVRDRVFCRIVADSWNPRFADGAVEVGDRAIAQRPGGAAEP